MQGRSVTQGSCPKSLDEGHEENLLLGRALRNQPENKNLDLRSVGMKKTSDRSWSGFVPARLCSYSEHGVTKVPEKEVFFICFMLKALVNKRGCRVPTKNAFVARVSQEREVFFMPFMLKALIEGSWDKRVSRAQAPAVIRSVPT